MTLSTPPPPADAARTPRDHHPPDSRAPHEPGPHHGRPTNHTPRSGEKLPRSASRNDAEARRTIHQRAAGKVNMKAREVMAAAVHAFTPDTPADLAAHYLHSHGYAAAPVTDDNGKLIGIVTATDLSTAANTSARRSRRHGPHRHAVPARVRDLMITPVESMTPGADITHIVDMMLDKNIDWLPIVDGHTIVGVITPADLFRAANPPTH